MNELLRGKFFRGWCTRKIRVIFVKRICILNQSSSLHPTTHPLKRKSSWIKSFLPFSLFLFPTFSWQLVPFSVNFLFPLLLITHKRKQFHSFHFFVCSYFFFVVSVTGSNVIDKKKVQTTTQTEKKAESVQLGFGNNNSYADMLLQCYTLSLCSQRHRREASKEKKKEKKLNHIYRDTFLEYEQPKQEETI